MESSIKLEIQNEGRATGDIRRIAINQPLTVQSLMEIARQLVPAGSEIKLQYIDEDGDCITITNDQELFTAIKGKAGAMKFIINVKNKQSTTQPTIPTTTTTQPKTTATTEAPSTTQGPNPTQQCCGGHQCCGGNQFCNGEQQQSAAFSPFLTAMVPGWINIAITKAKEIGVPEGSELMNSLQTLKTEAENGAPLSEMLQLASIAMQAAQSTQQVADMIAKFAPLFAGVAGNCCCCCNDPGMQCSH